MKREEVEMNLGDLRKKVESLSSTVGAGGVIIYAGDLKWTVDGREKDGGEREVIGYSPVDHLVVEIGRLVSQYNVNSNNNNNNNTTTTTTNNNNNNNNKVWLMGTANYQTYMRLKMKQPSLEAQWGLQAVSVPSGGLGLSLNASTTTTGVHESRVNLSNHTSQMVDRKPFIGKEEGDDQHMVVMTCCGECTSNYEKEAAALLNSSAHLKCNKTDNASSILPYWLQSTTPSETLHKEDLSELKRKWNRLCQSLHQGRHTQGNNYMNSSLINSNNQGLIGKSFSYNASSYPFWLNNSNHISINSSVSFADSSSHLNSQNGCGERSFPRFRRQQSCHIEFSFGNGNYQKGSRIDQEPNLDCLKSREDGKEVKITLGLGNALSSDSSTGEDVYKCLQENVPWHSEKIYSVVEFLLESSKGSKNDTWLLLEGNDSIGKRRLAMAIAEAMFGSAELFLCMNMRDKEGEAGNHCEKLEKALRDQENLLVLVEEVDFGDTQFLKFLSDGFEKGKLGEKGQVIFVLTKGDHLDDDKRRTGMSTIQMKMVVNEINSELGNSNFGHKRKANWDLDLLSKTKVPRIEEKETDELMIKKDLSRQSSSNTLDLNIKAEDQDEENENPLEFSPNSSDLTRETDGSPRNPLGFLETIKTRFVFDRSPARDSLMREDFLFKMKEGFKAGFGSMEIDKELLYVEEVVLDEVLYGCGYYLNNLFEKWLKEVFQTSLQLVKNGGKEGVKSVRVCLVEEKEGGGIEEEKEEVGFMSSNLPKKIKLCFIM